MLKELSEKSIKDEYLNKLISKLELLVANQFINNSNSLTLTDKEIFDLLRFADILSYSEKDIGKNLSFKILSLLSDLEISNEEFNTIFKSIMINLGNFPGIRRLEKIKNEKIKVPFEREIEEYVKSQIQTVPVSEDIFTDAQFEIFELLKSNNHFSFSGPTSLGKSFIIESYIKDLIVNSKIRDNIAILVPTRALINQTSIKLRSKFKNVPSYEIITHPRIPEFVKNKQQSYIFVFTPERLISYLSETDNPAIDYLFIDEAHKIVSEKDTRNPLYYHSILQAQKKSIKLFFASPNISNPEIYLELFDKSTDEVFRTTESPVSQNKYLLDLNERKLKIFGEYINQEIPINGNDFYQWLIYLSKGDNKSIVYCNSRSQTRECALKLAKNLVLKENSRIEDLIELITETIHAEYYLIDCLRKGVAFHYGDLPQRIRTRVEELFKEGDIDYLFCTSTLLEGVNLPAKNIFILSDKIGNSKFKKIDFLNLIGRAGRLNHEFSGNVIIIKENESNAWKSKDTINSLMSKDSLPPINSLVIKGNKKFYENILHTINNTTLTRSSITNYEEEILDHYSNIALIHTAERTNSILLGNLHRKLPDSINSLQQKVKNNKVPIEILKISSSIKLDYQNKIIGNKEKLIVLSSNPNYSEILSALNFLYEKYNWGEEEQGRKQIMKQASKDKHPRLLEYYAFIINSWFSSKPVSLMIEEGLTHHSDKKYELFDEANKSLGTFDIRNQSHVNIFINRLFEDIENLLRFRFMKYFNNYYLLLKHSLGNENAGANWAEFLEYGSHNKKIIELQNTGLPRHLAFHLFKNYLEWVRYDSNDNLIDFQPELIINKLKFTNKDIEKEFREFYGK